MSKTSAIWVQELKDPGCYPHPINEVSIVETHISWVILTGEYAYKIKKPVSFSFVDFSTLERRRWFCEEEVRLNRRLAPDVVWTSFCTNGKLNQSHIWILRDLFNARQGGSHGTQ